MSERIPVYEKVSVDPYGEGVFWGYTSADTGLVYYEMSKVSQWKLKNGQWPVGTQNNSVQSKFVIIFEVSITSIRRKGNEKSVSVPASSIGFDDSVPDRRVRSRKRSHKHA